MTIAEKHNEYPRPICSNYLVDYERTEINYQKINPSFNQKWLGITPHLLVHPFDLAILKAYCDYHQVKKVTELGCGSTSRFLDRVCKVKRTTFAKEDMVGYNFDFIECDIFESYDLILQSCKESQLFLIDAIHTAGMAEFYQPILELGIPVFIHDWYLPGEETWPEQNYWIENISYKPTLISRAVASCPKDSMVNGGIPPCIAILEK